MNTLTNHGIDLSVTVNGRPTRTYLHEGKYFIESREGTEYAIEVRNNNWYRVEVVAAVDGLSVITGKTASSTDSGYVVNARDKIVIKGFRKDHAEVGAFKFTKKEASYAAGKGEAAAANVGVIAVAIYKEKQPEYTSLLRGVITSNDAIFTTTDWMETNYSTNAKGILCKGSSSDITYGSATNANYTSAQTSNAQATATYSVSNNARVVSFDHGTTWGQKIQDKVVEVKFARSTTLPIVTTEVFYNSKENLEAIGIKTVQEKQVTLPVGFPSDFATPPPGWKG